MTNQEWIVEGNVWRVGDNVNTESIFTGGRTPCAEPLFPGFSKKVQKGDIWVAGSNFGCSSSRNAAGLLKDAGIGVILCHSSSRNNFRNSVDSGMPCFEIGTAVEKINMGDRVRVNVKTAEIKNLTTGEEIKARPFPDFMMETLETGGAIAKMLSSPDEYKIKVKERPR